MFRFAPISLLVAASSAALSSQDPAELRHRHAKAYRSGGRQHEP
jgi:hypothetical protein